MYLRTRFAHRASESASHCSSEPQPRLTKRLSSPKRDGNEAGSSGTGAAWDGVASQPDTPRSSLSSSEPLDRSIRRGSWSKRREPAAEDVETERSFGPAVRHHRRNRMLRLADGTGDTSALHLCHPRAIQRYRPVHGDHQRPHGSERTGRRGRATLVLVDLMFAERASSGRSRSKDQGPPRVRCRSVVGIVARG